MLGQACRMTRFVLFGGVIIFGILTIVASGGGGGGQPQPPPTTGSIALSSGFGAVSSTPYQCTGSANITINPQTLTGTAGKSGSETRPVSYSGFSSTTPNEPACQQSVIFTDLRTGSWQVTNGTAVCTTTVTAGQIANVKIWNNACR